MEPTPGKRSGEGIPSAATFGGLAFPTGSPGRRDHNHRSALDLPPDTCSRTETAQEAPQQRLFRRGGPPPKPPPRTPPPPPPAPPPLGLLPRPPLSSHISLSAALSF